MRASVQSQTAAGVVRVHAKARGCTRSFLPRLSELRAAYREHSHTRSTADFQDLRRDIRKMGDHSKYYITGAFVLGAVVAVGLQSFQHHGREAASHQQEQEQQQIILRRLSKIGHIDTLKHSLSGIEVASQKGAGNIKEGIEGCIGDTPLIKIKSLSEATGCEILAKAEVMSSQQFRGVLVLTTIAVFKWRW
jgi:hypothetical protein